MSIYATWLSMDIGTDEPLAYLGSHILPSDDDPRSGHVDVAGIPDHIEREGRQPPHEFLRLSMDPRAVVLTRPQVERLRDTLTNWLER